MTISLSDKETQTAQLLASALGGASNITKLDACLTRLRATVVDFQLVQKEKLEELGAMGVVYADGVVQAIFGKEADQLRVHLQAWIEQHPESGLAGKLISAFGGKQNIQNIDACLTRLRISVKATDKVDQEELKSLGALGTVVIGNNVQSIFGKQSDKLRQEMSQIISQ